MTDWKKIREQFPATEKYTYLNCAEGAPISIKAASEGKRFYDEMLMHGDLKWEEWLKTKEETRKKVAKLINADKEEIAFTLNTSHGINIIADMVNGDVLTMRDEFPSSTYPWINKEFNVGFVEPENAKYPIENIESKISKETKILMTSYVQYCTGFRQDLDKLGGLCRKNRLVFVVNATQGIGVMPVDVKRSEIDFLAFTSMKWPMAGYGIGVLYINKKHLGKFPVAGWQSVKHPDIMDNTKLDLKKEASEIEVGCPHFPNIFALGGALDLLLEIGKENVQRRIFELNKYLEEKLERYDIISPLEEKHRSGITVVRAKNPKNTVQRLLKKNIIVSARGEGIRISVNIYNNREDIDRLAGELKNLL